MFTKVSNLVFLLSLQHQFTCMTLFVNKKFLFRLFFCIIPNSMKSFDQFLSITIFLFGFLIIHRMYKCKNLEWIRSEFSSKIIIFQIAIFVLLIFFIKTLTPVKALLVCLSQVFIFILAEIFLKTNRERRFLDTEIELIRFLHLKISSGQSLTESLRDFSCHLRNQEPQFSENLNSFVTFRQQICEKGMSDRQKHLLNFLFSLINNPVNCREKLKSLERQLQIEQDFRRRSGQSLLNVKLQGFLMSLLFLGSHLFSYFYMNHPINLSVFLISLTLFLIGGIWLMFIGRSFKWKI